MRIERGDQRNIPQMRGSVLSIGNYDGVHLGHQALIHELRSRADKSSWPATVMTFEPYPWEFFQPNDAPSRLTSFPEKLELFENLGVEQVVCIEFDQEFANTKPIDFVNECLVERMKAECLVLGDDFKFGKDRAGSVAQLRELSKSYRFQVITVNSVMCDGKRVSSSGVRLALEKRDLNSARKLLGRRYSISGRVVHGDHRGREWGFPTANICLNPNDTPLRGVFSVLVYGLENRPIKGIANLGSRPTVAGEKFLLETHCLDFDRDVYGQAIRVEFFDWIRDERKFDGPVTLSKQIEKDINDARDRFNLNSLDD